MRVILSRSTSAKKFMARLTRFAIVRWLMRLAIAVVVPRQRIGAGLVLIDNQDRVLLLHHAFHGNYPWSTPGGWLNRHESPADGALRELREETGLSAHLEQVIVLQPSVIWPGLEVIYLATRPVGDIKLSFEIIDAQWFEIDNLPMAMLPSTREAIHTAWNMHQQVQVA